MGETREELTANLRFCSLQIMTARGELGRINGAGLGASRLCAGVETALCLRLTVCLWVWRACEAARSCEQRPAVCDKLSPPLGRTRCPKVYDGFRLRLRGRFALTGAGVPLTTTRLRGACRLHNRSILEYNDLNQPSRVRTVRCQFPRIGK